MTQQDDEQKLERHARSASPCASDGVLRASRNTDREIWREREGDYYADSIHVTERGGVGINCGGTVFVLPIRVWHALANLHHASVRLGVVAQAAGLISPGAAAESQASEPNEKDVAVAAQSKPEERE